MKHMFNTSIDEFMEELSNDRNKRETTVQAYWYNMSVVKKYLADHDIKYLEKFTEEQIKAMIKHFGKTCKNVTINKRMRLLKSIYKHFNIKNEYLESWKNLKRVVVHYDPFTESQLKRIMNYIGSLNTNNPYELTRVLIVFLLLDTGVRGSELLHIEINNINLVDKIIKLTHTKTGKQGFVFFSDVTKELLQEYLQLQPKRKYLFWNYQSYKSYSYIHLRNFMEHLQKECNLNKCHAHMFRHTFATLMSERGINDSVLQELMRHESIEQTRTYTHVSLKKKKKDHLLYGIISNLSSE